MSDANPNVTLLNQRISLGTKVVVENDLLLSEEFVKSGCPPHLRGPLWKQILQLNVTDKVTHYQNYRVHHPTGNLFKYSRLRSL